MNKPISIEVLRKRVEKLLVEARARQRALQLDTEPLEACQFEGTSRPQSLVTWQLFARIRRAGSPGGERPNHGSHRNG